MVIGDSGGKNGSAPELPCLMRIAQPDRGGGLERPAMAPRACGLGAYNRRARATGVGAAEAAGLDSCTRVFSADAKKMERHANL